MKTIIPSQSRATTHAALSHPEAERPASARELAAKHGMRPLSEENQRRNLQTARLRVRRHG